MTAEQMAPLMMTLGAASGEILTYLEQHGATTLRRLVRELEWPMVIITMAVGALVRQGLIRSVQHDLEVILEPRREWQIPGVIGEPVPEIWGG
jgi:DNA-binding MarR family transcriptional regulator